jgi:hypothetical protein
MIASVFPQYTFKFSDIIHQVSLELRDRYHKNSIFRVSFLSRVFTAYIISKNATTIAGPVFPLGLSVYYIIIDVFNWYKILIFMHCTFQYNQVCINIIAYRLRWWWCKKLCLFTETRHFRLETHTS